MDSEHRSLETAADDSAHHLGFERRELGRFALAELGADDRRRGLDQDLPMERVSLVLDEGIKSIDG